MKKVLLKMLYRKYRQEFLDMMVEEFYADMPKKISAPAMHIVSERREKLEKWLYYQAYHLSRRISKDEKTNDMIFGMLLQIKMLLKLINENTTSISEEESQSSNASEEKKQNDTLNDYLEGVNKFMKGRK